MFGTFIVQIYQKTELCHKTFGIQTGTEVCHKPVIHSLWYSGLISQIFTPIQTYGTKQLIFSLGENRFKKFVIWSVCYSCTEPCHKTVAVQSGTGL